VAIDAAGNLSTTSSLELLIDTIAPQLTIASPQYDSQIASGTRLQGTVNGTGSEIVQLSYHFNDLPSVPITFDESGKFDVELNLDKLQPGQQTLTVTTTDAANTSITTNLNLTLVLDRTAPVIEASLLDNTVGDGEIGNRRVRQNITDNPTIIGKVSDKNSGVTFLARVDDRQSSVDVSAYLKADGSFIFDRQQLDEINGGALKEGEHTFSFIARDLFGNESEPLNLSFILEEGSPKGFLKDTASHIASASRQEEVDNSLSEITDNQQRERSVVITPLASTITTSNLSNAAIKAEGSISISGNSDFDGEPLNLNDDAFIYAGKGFSINGKTVLPVKRNATGDPLTDSSGKPILVDQAVTVANGYLYSNVSASNRYSGLVPPQIVDKQTIDVPVYTTELNGELSRRIPAGTPTVTFNIAQNPLNNASDWAKKFPASGTTTAPTVVKVTGGGLNIPSNVSLNNYVITVESGDLNFNGSGHNLNNSVLVTKAGNINFANAQTKDVKAFASGSINMNGGASFAGDSLLANNSSSGNINFSGATSTIKGSDELKVFSAGSITYNGASQTRGNFVSAGNFTFNGNSTLYGAIAAKGNIAFNGNATVVVVNSAPSDLSLNPTASPENVANNSAIGTFTTTDANSNDTHVLSLVAGTGDTNNNAFTIVGNQLRINNSPDFETLSSQSIRVRTTDNAGASFEKVFTVNITDVNEAPTEIELNNLRINENVTNDSVVGIFNITDPDFNATHDLSLVAGEGDRDNAAFTIVGNQLRIKETPDFESKASYNLRVKATDVGGLSKETTLIINVNDLNEVPTDLSLSSINFDENLPASSEIATLHTVDADAGDSHSLSLVAGFGDSDNNAFTIDGDRLYFKDAADFETKANYNLRVRTTDAAGNSLEKILYLNVNNVNEAPTDITLSATSIAENLPIETVVATLVSSDPDAVDTHTYSLVAGEGDTDNSSFNLVGQELRLNKSADFESQSSYSIRIRSTDAGGLFKDEMVTISVQDSEDAEIALNLNLAQDTGADNTDKITSDPTISGTVENGGGDITLSASLNGADTVELGDLVGADGSFTLGNEQLKLIHNGDLGDGSYTLQLIAKDSGTDKTIEKELVFTLDTAAPTLNLITPLADGDHSSKARLTGTVTEDNLADVTYSLDGEEIGAVTVDEAGHFNSEIDPSGLELGTHNLKAIATDIAGNKTTTEISFQVGDNFLTPDGTKGWGAKNDSALILGEQDSYVVETSIPVDLGLATNEEGEQAGTRTISFDVDAVWDDLDAKAIEDQLLVYLVDPANPSQTLLDNGQFGTAVFSLAGEQSDFTPGLVTFDGKRVTIDASSLKDIDRGLLVFQLLNQDDDTGSSVSVNNLTSTTDLEGSLNPVFPEDDNPVAVGAALNFDNLTQAKEVSTIISNVRFDAATGEYRAAVSIKNNGATAIARNSVVVFNNLPDGVELASPSGTDSQGNPYVNLRAAIASGGLDIGGVSETVEVTFNNPNLLRFGLDTSVYVGRPNSAPVFKPIDHLTVVPGAKLALPLTATDRDGDPVTYQLQSDNPLPTGKLEGDGTLRFNPKPDEIGSYEFTLIATDGVESVSQTVTLDVVADPITTTRISGVIENVEQQPLAGVVIELGELETVTAADGSFTIETDQPLTADTLKVRGEGIEGDKVYPFIAEKLPLILGQEVYEGYNNIIDRPIYLPALDVAGGKVIDPNKDITVTSPKIPGASVFVEAGSLINQSGQDFTGKLSITEVPTELTPAALPENLSPDLVVTIQPGEMVFNTPAPLSLPNLSGYAPGTKMDLWSINPETGDFDNVGMGIVSDDGSVVETVAGGIRNSSWHFFAPPPQNPENNNPPPVCDECEEKGDWKSEVEFNSGAVIEDYDLVSYSSNGESRGVTLTYDSVRADPRPIVQFGYEDLDPSSLAPGFTDKLRIMAELNISGNDGFDYQVPGFAGGEYGLNGGEHFWSLPNKKGDANFSLQADLSSQASGKYDYTLTSGIRLFVRNQFVGSSSSSESYLLHVNSVDSAFGSGWGIAGWQEIVENRDGSLLLIDGDGSESWFDAPEGEGEPYVNPPGDFSVLEKLPDGTFRRTTTDQMVYQFNSANALASTTDRYGNQTSYEYNSQEKLTKIVDSVGLATVFSYNQAGLVSKITDPAQRKTLMEYDRDGNLINITAPDNSTFGWQYDNSHHMVGEIDASGNTATATYDQFGRASTATQEDGSVVRVDPVQTQRLYPTQATANPLTFPLAFVDNAELTGTYADANGNVIQSELDALGQRVGAIDGGGNTGTVERNEENLITSRTDAKGFETNYTYDERGNVLSITEQLASGSTANLPDKALQFDGIDDAVENPIVDDIANTFTLEFWVNPTATRNSTSQGNTGISGIGNQRYAIAPTQGGSTIGSGHAGAGVSVGTNGISVFEHSDYYLPSTLVHNTPLSGWNHVAIVYDNKTPSLYLNGQFIKEGLTSNYIVHPSLALGSLSYYGAFEGQIDEIRLWDFARTEENIQRDRLYSYQGNQPGLAAYLRLDEGEGNSVIDLTENKRNGRLVNGTSWSDDAAPLVDLVLTSESIDSQDFESGIGFAERSYTYDPIFNQLTSETDELGRQTLYDIDPNNGNLLATTRVVGQVGGDDDLTTSYTYTDAGLVDTMTDPNSRVTDYQYDRFGHLIKQIQAVGTADEAVITYEYDAAGNQIAMIDAKGERTEFEYDGLNRLTQTTYAVGTADEAVETTEYDGNGNQIATVDGLGNRTEFKYDEKDRLVKTIATDPDGEGELTNPVSTNTYDHNGNLITTTDPLGRETSYVYDSRNRLVETILPDGTTTKSKYDQKNNLVASNDAVGETTKKFYDSRDRLIGEIDAQGHEISYEYDAVNQLVAVVDANGNKTEYEYDELGRQISVTDGEGNITLTEYDKVGNVVATIDGQGNRTEYGFDERDRNTTVTDAEGGVTTTEYDDVGNVISVTDPVNNQTSYTYDAQNRVTEETNELGFTRTFAYDDNGNAISTTDRNGRTREFTFDGLNRQVEENWLNDAGNSIRTTNSEYDAASQLIATDDPDSAYNFTYDELGRLVTVDNAGTPGVPNVVLTYNYDEEGNVISVKDTIDGVAGATTAYSYDDLDRVDKITQSGENVADKRVNFAYDAIGQYESVTRYSDLEGTDLVADSSYTYDNANRLSNLSHSNSASEIANYDLTYDAASRITQIVDADGTHDYRYDQRDQLVGANHGTQADEAYSYDANGNRVSSSLHEDGYVTDANNRLASDGTYNYEYDHQGNLVKQTAIATGEIQEFSWDYGNRLVAVVDKDAAGNETQRVEFTYDMFGRRLSKTVDGEATYFVYDRDNVILDFVENDSDVVLDERYLHGDRVDQVLAQDDGKGDVIWHLSDHLGSVRDLVDSDGNSVNHFVYDSFGNVLDETDDTIDTRYLYTGREFDQEIGLQYNRARYYNPELGIFVSEDPISFDGGDSNFYRNVGNNPLSNVDPFGTRSYELSQLLFNYSHARGGQRSVQVYNTIFPEYYSAFVTANNWYLMITEPSDNFQHLPNSPIPWVTNAPLKTSIEGEGGQAMFRPIGTGGKPGQNSEVPTIQLAKDKSGNVHNSPGREKVGRVKFEWEDDDDKSCPDIPIPVFSREGLKVGDQPGFGAEPASWRTKIPDFDIPIPIPIPIPFPFPKF
jgi:RHS repeat-associated protein